MSTIVTFYSYKGGVGRTMAMANVAVLLAQRKLKVLAVDWDLEAPGLERYFGYFSVTRAPGGLLRLLKEQQQGSRGHYQRHLTRVTGTLVQRQFELDVLPSGRETDPGYSSTLEHFNWEEYFSRGGGEFIEELRIRWRKDYDVVLVDSRTGLSDTGGICTIQMPDVVVAMFTANYQSLHGVRDTMRLAQTARNRLSYDRMHLRVLPVPSRFSSRADTPEATDWLDRIGEALEDFYQDWIPKWAKPRQVSEALRIPQIDTFGFGEKLAVVEEEGLTTRPMTAAYEQIADLLAAEVPDTAAILHLARTEIETTGKRQTKSEEYQYDLFVSYAGTSVLNDWIDALIVTLRGMTARYLGREVRVFQDRSELQVDEVWKETTAPPLARSRAMLALISTEFIASRWCRVEWATFEKREMNRPGRDPLIVPVIIQPTPELPDWISRRTAFDITDLPRRASVFATATPRLNESLDKLARVLAQSIRSAPPFSAAWAAEIDLPSDAPSPAMPPAAGSGSDVALRAEAMAALLRNESRPDALIEARDLLRTLRHDRDFVTMAKLAGAIHDQDPNDYNTSLQYARALIEIGDVDKAQKLLSSLVAQRHRNEREFSAATGLLGRVYKQRFVANASKKSAAARAAMLHALKAYRAGYDMDPSRNIWHGVNIVALSAAARRHRIKTGMALNEKSLARTLLARLQETPESLRYVWDIASAAELQLALGNWQAFGELLQKYMDHPDNSAVELNSFLRQLTELWELESDAEHGAPHIAALRARVLSTPGGSVTVRPIATSPSTAGKTGTAEESFFGQSEQKSLEWLRRGLDRSASVGIVADRGGRRRGTCFVVRAADFGFGLDGDELLVLTASHVVSSGTEGALRPTDATVTFESSGSPSIFKVIEEVWTSPPDRCDATFLRLDLPPETLQGLPIAVQLPSLDVPQRLYIIGDAGRQQLAFSLEDNELLDHEGPPDGTPAIPGIVRLHYRTPTAAGNSGSPVFDSEWRVVALHHAGGVALSRLNGKPGTYTANEGIWIQSIAAAAKHNK